MPEGKSPENSGEKKGNRPGEDEVQHEPGRLAERLDEEPRRDVGHDDHRDNPAKDELEEARENYIGIAGDVEKVEVPVNKSLGANDPEADRGQCKHDRVMNGDPEANRHE